MNVLFATLIGACRFTDFSALQFLVRARIRVIRVNLDQWKRTFVRVSGEFEWELFGKKKTEK